MESNGNNGVNEPLKSTEDGSGLKEARDGLQKRILTRKPSLSVAEEAFLSALLLDKPPASQQAVSAANDDENDWKGGDKEEGSHDEMIRRASRVLDNDMLFSIPVASPEKETSEEGPNVVPPKTKRFNQSYYVGLWKAYEDGVTPRALKRKSKRLSVSPEKEGQQQRTEKEEEDKTGKDDSEKEVDEEEEGGDVDSIRSDEEVRPDRSENPADGEGVASAAGSSWALDEGGFDHYDAWEVLKDEYAEDFGFSTRNVKLYDDDDDEGLFKILGTSADDVSAHPHVLSPPLMEALLNFVPDSLAQQNFWLKFSLVRDGANLDTMKRYVRAAECTVLAIETTNGDVFGSFTSSAWRQHFGYFGGGESFLWKMRHSRMTPCHSLFEQAEMESEINVYAYSGLNDYIQLCMADKIAVGGGELDTSGNEQHGDTQNTYVYLDEGEHFGFGLAVSEDLLHGTSSPCATFRNPCLSNHSSHGEVFEIVNLEIWGFTPMNDVSSAEKLEMTKFFVQETLSTASSKGSTSHSGGGRTRPFSSSDLIQEEFYRRAGHNDQSEARREGWEYAMMMNPVQGIAASTPKFTA